MRDFICACMYVRGQCVTAMESIRDRKDSRGELAEERGRRKREGILRTGGMAFLWWYWYDGCLAEAPKAVAAWILACHLGQGH